MQDLNDLYYFVHVVDQGGFSAASRSLGIPKSRLSRRIADLEARLNTRLLQRSTRQVSVTELGQRYYEHCRAMLVEADAAQHMIDHYHTAPRGIIKVSCPIGLLGFHVADMLADFMTLHPDVCVHLDATNRRVDLLAEGVDVAIRVRPLPLEDSDLVMRVLSDRGQRLVASPALLATHGTPTSPEDLAHFPSLSRSTPHEPQQWHLRCPNGEALVVTHQPRYITTDMQALLKAALAGVGIVQLPVLMLERYLETGELVAVLPQYPPRREVIHLVFPSRRGLLPSVRALIDFLAARYAAFDED